MKLFEILNEAREDYIANAMNDKIIQAYQSDTSHNKPKLANPLELVVYISQNTDPKYLQWTIKQYILGKFKLEDVSRIKNNLAEFDRVRPKLQVKDINQYKTLGDLYNALAPFQQQEIISGKQQAKNEYQALFNSGAAEYFYKGKTLDVVIPHTKEASCELGKGTKWCTAATKSDNRFGEYNNDGPLYIIRTRDGRKFQFHFESDQFMDEHDQEIDVSTLVKQYPELLDAFNKVATKHAYLPLVKNQTPEICLAAVKKFGYALQYVKKQTPEICLAAVKQNGYAIQLVEKQTPEICIAAVNQYGYVLRFVENPTPEVCMAAVKQNGLALRFVENQTPELCEIAVKQNGLSLQHVKNQTPEICLAAVKQHGYALEFVEKQTPKLCEIAVKQIGSALKYVENQTLEICLAAVSYHRYAINYIADPKMKQQVKDKLGIE